MWVVVGTPWRQEREERQNEGKVQRVTTDTSWIHTSVDAAARTWYVCAGLLRQQGSRRKFGSVVCFLSELHGWEELSCWEMSDNRIIGAGEEETSHNCRLSI